MSDNDHHDDVRIVDYAPRHRDAFRTLNLEWIERWFVLEDADRLVLDDPESTILAGGGHILMAVERDGAAIGCCALIREPDDAFELAKMAVAPAAQGRGVGLMLGRAAIEWARQAGARRIELVTNSGLAPALRLYRRLGFVDVPVGASEYARADTRMVLPLDEGPPAVDRSPSPR